MNINQSLHDAPRNIKFGLEDLGVFSKLVRGKSLVPYIGFVGWGNLGDELLFDAHKKLFPRYQFMLYRKESPIIEKVVNGIRPIAYPCAVLGGGTLINRGIHWIDRVEHILEGHNKMFCLGTGVANPNFWKGANDFGGDVVRRWVKALGEFQFVGVRGPYSLATLNKTGFKDAQITGDTALTLTEDTYKPEKSHGIIGVNFGTGEDSVMWGDPAAYRAELIKAIKEIIAAGYKVNILPIRVGDIDSNVSLIKEIDHPKCRLVMALDNWTDYAAQVKKCDLFIGQKLHSTIIAYMNRVPAIMIEYRPKCRDFMSSIGLEDYVIKTSEFELKPFMQKFDQLQKHHESIRKKAESKILEYKYLQSSTAKRIKALLAE